MSAISLSSVLIVFVPALFFHPKGPVLPKPFKGNPVVLGMKFSDFPLDRQPIAIPGFWSGKGHAEFFRTALKMAPAVAAPDAAPDGPKTPAAVHPVVKTEIQVVAPDGADASEGFNQPITVRQVETTAGTFGDVSRFLQTVAGVVSDNDQRNDVLVRGGNPSENLFVIDNIEIPSINQLALSDTTGGFVSMLDANAIQQITLHTDAYDSRFEQRLSSVVEISTRPAEQAGRHAESEMGIAGLGGSMTRPLGEAGSLFVSGRQSVMSWFTDDIGMNGVPKYRNAFVRADGRMGERNTWWGISLTGIDSIDIAPSAADPAETNPYDVKYSGWRNTTGLNWQHVFSARSYGVASVAHAEQVQSVAETGQLQAGALVYNEKTGDGISTLKYDFTQSAGARLTLTAGARASLDQVNYRVAQPIGLQNPYSESPEPLDAGAFSHQFGTFSSSAYAQAALALPKGATLIAGGRGMQWALGGHAVGTGKALFSAPVFGHLAHVGYAELAQLPPTLYLLSFANLKALEPIRCRQWTAGALLADGRRAKVTLEAYDKTYAAYPVAANLPQLSLANVADTFGQAFLMFPMVAKGQGLARGVELSVQEHLTSRISVAGTMAYSRSLFTGLDGVWRRGNFDIPLVANAMGTWEMAHGFTVSGRFSTMSGRPYTPDNLALSLKQNRDVYDLNQIDGLRSSAYARLDFRVEQARKLGRGVLTWHAGLQNALDRNNFYSYLWQPRSGGAGVSEQDQMPLFPDGGMKYAF